MNQPQSNQPINTDGGFVNTGTIASDSGNVAGRDMNIAYYHLSPDDYRYQRSKADLRQKVRNYWIDTVFKNSLYNKYLFQLGLEIRPDAVDNQRGNLIVHLPNEPEHISDDKQSITALFEQMNRKLLILGEPGAGKTTYLLALANALLLQADADSTLPTPVIFNLSSWAKEELSLEEWLLRELHWGYDVPSKDIQIWLKNYELLLLLDGLDEVTENKRVNCVKAINDFCRTYTMGMIVSCRATEYNELPEQLRFGGAVTICPLTHEQVDKYIEQADPYLIGLRRALEQSKDLRELSKTPLLLNVMSIAYHGIHTNSFENSERNERKHLFDCYIQRMFEYRGLEHLYTPKKTLQWLRWLASRLIEFDKTQFSVYDLTNQWITSRNRFWALLKGTTGDKRPPTNSILVPVRMEGNTFSVPSGLGWEWENVSRGFMDEARDIIKIRSLEDLIHKELVLMMSFFFGLLAIYGLFIEEDKWMAIRVLIFSPLIAIVIGVMGNIVFKALHLLVYAFASLSTGITIKKRTISHHPKAIAAFNWPAAVWGAIIMTVGTFLVTALLFSVFDYLEWSREYMAHQSRERICNSEPEYLSLPPDYCLEIAQNRSTRSIPNPYSGVTIKTAVIISAFFGTIVALFMGFYGSVSRFFIRFLLYLNKSIPFRYNRFLDFCTERYLLYSVGHSYIFVHKLIMEHIASLTDEDITRITSRIVKSTK